MGLGYKCVDNPLVRPNKHDYRFKAFAFMGLPGDKAKQLSKLSSPHRVGVHVHAIMLFHDSIARKLSTDLLAKQMELVAKNRLARALEGSDVRHVPVLLDDADRMVAYLAEIMNSNLLDFNDCTRTDLFEVWPRWS